jgi:hypothetical protein
MKFVNLNMLKQNKNAASERRFFVFVLKGRKRNGKLSKSPGFVNELSGC